MTAATTIPTKFKTTTCEPATLDQLVQRLGGIPLSRILAQPPPGSATGADLIEAQKRFDRLYELVDGVLVEKGMGYTESLVAGVLIEVLRAFVVPRNLGVISGADGIVQLFPGLVRVPDVAFASWDRFPERKLPKEPIPSLAPDLAIEVLSASNTTAEMQRKRDEYFAAGVRLVWEIDPATRKVAVYSPDGAVVWLEGNQILDGGSVLPGFTLNLANLFAELDRHG
jgi:Uma2 family endonuclease